MDGLQETCQDQASFSTETSRDIVLPSDQRTIQRWFNTDAGFNKVANQQRTTRQVRTFPLRFSFLRGHDINNADLSVIKRTEIREGKNWSSGRSSSMPSTILYSTRIRSSSIQPLLPLAGSILKHNETMRAAYR